MLDYGIIQPRLQRLYEWSVERGEPSVLDLVRDLGPVYVWPFENRDVWEPARPTRTVRALDASLQSADAYPSDGQKTLQRLEKAVLVGRRD
jgi:hypothetical protein